MCGRDDDPSMIDVTTNRLSSLRRSAYIQSQNANTVLATDDIQFLLDLAAAGVTVAPLSGCDMDAHEDCTYDECEVTRLCPRTPAAPLRDRSSPLRPRDDYGFTPSDPAAPLDVLRPVIDKALTIQQRAHRTAISAEDWRYTNGYNDCLAAVLSVLDPDDTLRWVRDPEAEAQRQARAALTPAPKEADPPTWWLADNEGDES